MFNPWLAFLLILLPTCLLGAEENTAAKIARHIELAGSLQTRGEPIRAESEYRQALGLALEQLGLIYHSLGDLSRAEVAYRSVSETLADSDLARLGLAAVYLGTGEFEKGLAVVQNLLKEKPFHPEARHLLGKLYFSMNRFEAAALELEEAARLAPDNFSVAFTLALAHLKQRQLERARRIFDRMLKELGESARIHILFGGAYREAEFVNEAVEEFRRAIQLDPTYPRVHYYLGLAYLSQEGRNKIPEAMAELEEELRRDTNDYLSNYLLGLVYLSERELQKAVPYLRKAMEVNPENPESYLYLGQALSLLDRNDEAVPLLQKAIETTKDPSRNQYQVANAHYLLGQAYRRLGKGKEAREHLAQASEYKAQASEVDRQRLQLYIRSGKPGSEEFEKAVQSLKGAVVVAPEPPDAESRKRLQKAETFYVKVAADVSNQLGLLDAGRSNYKRAANFFAGAAFWDYDLPDVHYNLGLAHFKAQDYAKAIPAFEAAQSRQPTRTSVRALLGLSYFYGDRPDRAVQQIQPLASELKDDAQMMSALALSLIQIGQAQKGETILKNLLQEHPNVPQLHLALGQIQAQLQNYENAIQEFQKSLELDSALPEAHYYIGMSYLRQGKFVDAVTQFRQEVQRNPVHAKASYHLGFALIALKQVEEGVQWMKEAASLDPAYAEPYYEIGKVQLQEGKTSEAIESLERAAEVNPNKSYIHYQLSQAYLKAGNREAAQKALDRYRQLKAQERGNP